MSVPFPLFFSALALLLSGSPAAAPAPQDHQRLRAMAGAWLEQQARLDFPLARARVSIGPVDARLRLAACDAPHFFLSANATLWGRGTLGASCRGTASWTLYLSYESELRGPALVLNRPLPARSPLADSDVALREVVYTRSPDAYPRELPANAHLARALAADQAIQVDWLMLPNVIRAGQNVRVRIRGAGFTVAQEGVALNAASPGDPVRARVPSGRIVHGIANSEGIVELQP